MSQKNTLTGGGAFAGGVTALSFANDLASLTMFGISCLDGRSGFDVDLAVVEAGTRVCAVLWGVAVTVGAALLGRFIARYIEPPKGGATV